jgi:hypothetical protein
MSFLKVLILFVSFAHAYLLEIGDVFDGVNTVVKEDKTQEACKVIIKGINKNTIKTEIRLGEGAMLEIELEKKDNQYGSVVRRVEPDEAVTETVTVFEFLNLIDARMKISVRNMKRGQPDEEKALLDCELKKVMPKLLR